MYFLKNNAVTTVTSVMYALANLPTCQPVWKNTPSRTENSLKITPEILDKRVCRVVYLQLSTNTKTTFY